jgi:hypothetical protein
MQHRHLLPDEIDQLLDGETGFGVAPLRAHLDECPGCRARIADAQIVVEALERLPHFAPNARFADRVLQQVHIVEPWHIAAIQFAKNSIPQSRPMRVVMGATTGVVAVVISASAVWIALRADVALYAYNLIADRLRASLVIGVGGVIGDTFGPSALDAIRTSGTVGIAMGVGVTLAAVGGATFGFRALAKASRRPQG